MGRHAGDWTAPDPAENGKSAGRRRPLHADLFTSTHGGMAARGNAERTVEAFEKVVEPHREHLRAFVARLTEGDDAVADSILKETLYRAAQEAERYVQRPSAVRPMLVLTARAVLRDGERHAPAGHDDRPFLPRTAAVLPAEGPLSSAPREMVVGALRDLSASHRELILELFYGGASLEEAAANRSLSVDHVKGRLHRAMRALRAGLDRRLAEG
jgi:RNA polymerase sigma-70 factor (ECF subfamily)